MASTTTTRASRPFGWDACEAVADPPSAWSSRDCSARMEHAEMIAIDAAFEWREYYAARGRESSGERSRRTRVRRLSHGGPRGVLKKRRDRARPFRLPSPLHAPRERNTRQIAAVPEIRHLDTRRASGSPNFRPCVDRRAGSVFALRWIDALVMLHLDPLEPRTPQLPRPRFGALTQLATSAALHVTLVMVAALGATSAQSIEPRKPVPVADQRTPDVRHIVFLVPARKGGGGGGGGNQQAAPIRRAQSVGSDAITVRVRKTPPPPASPSPIESVPAIPSVVLEAKPLASGVFEQIGLPTGGVLSGTSTGPGSGGGVGTGIGTGIGSGRGPGLGPGSGGGTGGGVYRPGGAVSGPRLIKEVKPSYTNDALRHKIQGAVVLETVVTADGCPSQIRVIRSLDPGGLDAQAVAAVAQWQFEPGRLGDTPVDVLVTIQLDFRIW